MLVKGNLRAKAGRARARAEVADRERRVARYARGAFEHPKDCLTRGGDTWHVQPLRIQRRKPGHRVLLKRPARSGLGAPLERRARVEPTGGRPAFEGGLRGLKLEGARLRRARSSVVIRGHPWSSVVIRSGSQCGTQWDSEAIWARARWELASRCTQRQSGLELDGSSPRDAACG